jgi:hypothetical protein
MDGVLADFMYGFLTIHGREDLAAKHEAGEYPMDWTFEGEFGMDEEEWWKPIREEGGIYFWESLNPLPYSGNIIKLVKSTGLPWYICTTPYYKNADCVHGKINWLHRYLGPIENIIMMKDKWRLAHPGAYLIDDSDKNYNKFIRAGGNGFLLPQTWNEARNQVNDRMGLLKYHLESFVEEEVNVGV